jgi:hypothetical protein
MKARIIVVGTVFIAWSLNIFLFVNTGAESLHLLLPATGGFYPLSISSGDLTYYPTLMYAWFLGELMIFTALGVAAFIKRSTSLAVICSLLWLGSIATGIFRFAANMSGIH